MTLWRFDAAVVSSSAHPHSGSLLCAAVDPSGAEVMLGSEDGEVSFVTATTHEVKAPFRRHELVVNTSYSATGSFCLSSGAKPSLIVWDVRRRAEVYSSSLGTNRFPLWLEEDKLGIWEPASGEIRVHDFVTNRKDVIRHHSPVDGVERHLFSISPDTQTIAVVTSLNEVRLLPIRVALPR
jgi:WD40 repeat protein